MQEQKSLAPEPYFTAALYVLQSVALFLRSSSTSAKAEQLSDLGNAVHNIPASLAYYGQYFDEQKIRSSLAAYDRQWTRSSHDFSLIRTLEEGIALAGAESGAGHD